MSATDRQNRLLVAEDWKRVYQTFRNADFQSYDFDNLRRTMINYLRKNYPEDFNDYIESSEYLALIDLIAFLGQNLAFRIDLNARENYLELAERRESVLRLARLLSYNPKRNQAANGLLKMTAVRTTEDVLDSNNVNLAGQTIEWNDSTNTNWYEQFIKVINTALPVNGVFGRPNKKETVSGIPTEQYRVNGINTNVPVYSFEKPIEAKSTPFQVVSTDIEDGNLQEEAPIPGNNFAFIYRDDGQGAGSTNTGFFAHFRQGLMNTGEFSVTQPTSNQTIAIDTTNINNSDVWLYKLDSNANESEFWTKLEAVEGNNIIYNSLTKQIRNVYTVNTRVDDRINLVFSDGVFGNLPKGNFRVYYRTSANRNMIISPQAINGIEIEISYLSKTGKVHTLTMTYSLQYTVSNGQISETNESIKRSAPSTYYTQNRMITGEDYNVGPLGISQDIVKVKSVNRTSSGISRYFDLIDATGKYSNTNLYGNDGVIYKQEVTGKTSFTFNTQTDIEGVIINDIEPILADRKVKHFYFDKLSTVLAGDLGAYWNVVSEDVNSFSGYFDDIDNTKFEVGSYTSTSLRFIEPGSIIKFVAPQTESGFPQHFMEDGTIMQGVADHPGSRDYIWTKVLQVESNGIDSSDPNLGGIILSDKIPTGAQIDQIRPRLATSLLDDVKTEIIDQAFAYNDFALRYDREARQWRLIKETDIDKRSNFATGFAGDVSNQNLDASWIVLFETDGETYTITYRAQRYVFESDKEIRFWYDSNDKIFDSKTGKIVKDKISLLNINTKPGEISSFTRSFDWEVLEEYRDAEGYVDSTKVEVTFSDVDNDDTVDDPELFEVYCIDQSINADLPFVFLEKYRTQAGTEDFRYIGKTDLGVHIVGELGEYDGPIGSYSQYDDGQLFYYPTTNTFRKLDTRVPELKFTADYRAFIGRDNIKFQYVHVADTNARIDPSASNIIDSYLLTKDYDRQFRLYLDGQLASKPLPPSTDQLYRSYGQEINKIKSISDEVIYHPVKYKPLFGKYASSDLQATFKLVKNPDQVLNDNDVKTRVIDAINQFFALENWEFGDTFYFQELVTYVMNRLAPDLVTMVIVPKQAGQVFGSLFEIRSEADEIFINSATVADVQIIDELTASRLNASGTVLTSSNISGNTGIISTSSISSSSSSNGGSSY
jgi:hypothetical protein